MRYLKSLVLLAFITSSFVITAQNSKVETVRLILEEPDPNAVKDLRECKSLIDAALVHPKTANSPKMWVYRGAVYFEIASDSILFKEFPDALFVSSDALFKCKETDVKNQWSDQSDYYLLNVANKLFNAGVSEYQNKNYDKAIQYYQTTLRIIPYDKKGDLKTVNINEDLIYQYSYYASMAKGDNTKTKEYINKLIDRNFNDPNIYTALAKVYLEEFDTTNALRILTKGRELFSSNDDLMNMELDVYLRTGKTDILLKKLDDAIALDDQNKIYYFARASTYDKMNKPDLAEKDYRKALELDPDYYDAIFNIGVLHVNRARPLIEQLQKVYKRDEQDAIEIKIKEVYSEALKYFEKCLEIGVPGNNRKEKFELIESMQHLYKNTGNKDKEMEMKKLKEEI